MTEVKNGICILRVAGNQKMKQLSNFTFSSYFVKLPNTNLTRRI